MGKLTFNEPAYFRGEYRTKGSVIEGVEKDVALPYTNGDKPLGAWEESKAEELKDLPLERLQSTAAAQGIETDGVSKAELVKKLKG